VVHPRRLEWGQGVVEQASSITHEGQPAQRVVVVFEDYGRVTINTAVAPLISKEAAGKMDNRLSERHPHGGAAAVAGGSGWLGKLEAKSAQDPLRRLPAAMTDPFESELARLRATVESFRFGDDPSRHPRGLIEWATAQSGLSDPLSQYNRHELEEAYRWFQRTRDEHLRGLVDQLARMGEREAVSALSRQVPYPTARVRLEQALRACPQTGLVIRPRGNRPRRSRI
jgi:hypothetical protein